MSDRGGREAAPDTRVPATVRAMAGDDAEAVRAIYNAEVLDSTVTMDLVPRTLAEQQAWIAAHAGAYAAVVAEDGGGQVVGFASISPWRDRPAYRGSVENSVYVARSHQGMGLGRILLGEILARATDSGFHACFARIADGNEASIRLHDSLGFFLVGVERQAGRKFNRWIDVTVMEKLLQK